MPRFVDCYKDYNVEAANISLGRGTASSDAVSYTHLDVYKRQIHLQMYRWNRHQALLICISSHQEKHSLSVFPYR